MVAFWRVSDSQKWRERNREGTASGSKADGSGFLKSLRDSSLGRAAEEREGARCSPSGDQVDGRAGGAFGTNRLFDELVARWTGGQFSSALSVGMEGSARKNQGCLKEINSNGMGCGRGGKGRGGQSEEEERGRECEKKC